MIGTQALTAGSHTCVVQAMPSSGQTTGAPGWQPLALHSSNPLQVLPSLQSELDGVFAHVPLGSRHSSTLHPTPSSQFTGTPGTQPVCALHVSIPSQVSPSLQAASLVGCKQSPFAGLQLSRVQPMPSSHWTGLPGWQTPPRQTSVPLQRSASTHCALLEQGWNGVHPFCWMTQD